jgi:ABC-type transport system involved in cytochrome c biogenesis permease subunit
VNTNYNEIVMPTVMGRITVFCFAASYAVALVFELLQLRRPRPIQRGVSLSFGSAGLLAHTIFVLVQDLPLVTPQGSLLLLAWILAVFYLYGSFHHRRIAWGLFVLPLVLGLIGLAEITPHQQASPTDQPLWTPSWGMIHGTLLLLAAAGLCVGFVASLMYLVQVQRLKAKLPPTQGVRLLSLERLEDMNRRAILWAFPLLTAGLLVALVSQFQSGTYSDGLGSPKLLFTVGLWIVFAILLYLRYGAHARGRQVALLTVLAFGLMLVALVSVHPLVQGGGP